MCSVSDSQQLWFLPLLLLTCSVLLSHSVASLDPIAVPFPAAVDEKKNEKRTCAYFINNNGHFPVKKTASCPNRGMFDVPKNKASGSVSVLDLRRNKIQTLHEASFLNWEDIEELSLADNTITTITEKAFKPLRKLRSLNLSGNGISLKSMSPNVFKYVPQLQKLDLSHNAIFRIADYYFSRLQHLEELRLGYSKNIELHPKSLAGLHNLKILDLTSNSLRSMPAGMKLSFKNMSLEELLLGGNNQWECDCNLRWLKIWYAQRPRTEKLKLKSEIYTAKNERHETEPICQGPRLARGKALFGQDIHISDFQCPPKVRNPPRRYVRPINSNLTLTCKIYADPKGVVTWYKDGTLVQKHWHRTKVTQSQGINFTAKLVIVDLQKADAGEWLCEAQNRRGRVSRNFTVEVLDPSRPVSQWLIRVLIYSAIGVAGAILLSLGIGLVAYCVNYRRKDYRGYNKGTSGPGGSATAETRRLHTPTDAANPATDESDYEPPVDSNGPPPPPPPPPPSAAATAELVGLGGGGMTLPRISAAQPGNSATLRLEKVPLTGSEITAATLPRSSIALKPPPTCTHVPGGTQSQRDHCPVHGTPTGGTYRPDGHYSPCPVHGDATLTAAAVARTAVTTSGQCGGHNNPLYGTLPAGGRYKPCPLHGDVYATLQTRQGSTSGTHHPPAGLQSPSQGSNASSTTVALQTIMRSKDNGDGAHATYIRASRVDDCISTQPTTSAATVSNTGQTVPVAPGGANESMNGLATLPKLNKGVIGVKPMEDEGYSTSV